MKAILSHPAMTVLLAAFLTVTGALALALSDWSAGGFILCALGLAGAAALGNLHDRAALARHKGRVGTRKALRARPEHRAMKRAA